MVRVIIVEDRGNSCVRQPGKCFNNQERVSIVKLLFSFV